MFSVGVAPVRRHLPAAGRRVVLRADGGEQHLERRDAELQAERAVAVVRKEPVVGRLERQAGGHQHRFVAGAADLEEDLALTLELNFLVVKLARQQHAAIGGEQLLAVEALGGRGRWSERRVSRSLTTRPSSGRNYSIAAALVYARRIMSSQPVRLHRWDEIALEKVTEMLSRKIVTGEREMLAQIYLKRGCLVPMHSHESEQMTYVLQGALKFLIGGEEITVREGEVLHIPSWVEHQAEALEDTFELDVFSPIRQDWLDHTDDYFHR